MKNFYLFLFICLGLVTSVLGAPPTAPNGKQWTTVPELTDEFNGNAVDASKWYDYHPNWSGRLPSKFKKGNAYVKDGYLQLKSTLAKDPSTVNDPFSDYWVDAAALVSKERSAKPGYYYEARMKASNLSMTSSFWFRIGDYSEIDVIEHIGNPTNNKRDADLPYQYHANTHIYGTKSGASNAAQWAMPTRGRDEFHTYGFWWKTPDTLWFYHNNVKVMEIVPNTSFAENLKLIFDTEVFPFATAGVASIGLPLPENLQDTSKNTALVDWVRTYKLVDKTSAASTTESISFVNPITKMSSSSTITYSMNYSVKEQRDLVLILNNPEGKWLGSTRKTVNAGSGTVDLTIDLETYTPTPRSGHKVICDMRTVGGDYTTNIESKNITVTFTPNESFSGTPAAPAGEKWVPLDILTDEFNESSLDGTKWIDHHAGGWNGRVPSQYKGANVSVSDGMLKLLSDVKNEDSTGNWVNSACVSSPAQQAMVGCYYEASIRGSDISMTSAFWLQGNNTEIDVIENFGNTTASTAVGDYYYKQRSQMKSNTHSFSQGWNNDITTPMDAELDAESDNKFFTYGVYWKDKNTVIMYLNGDSVYTMTPGENFTENMYMFFDTETFQWQGYPIIKNLKDPDKNTMYVNWVRSYKLVDDTAVATDNISFTNNITEIIQSKEITASIDYNVSAEKDILLALYDSSNVWIGSVRKTVNAGSGTIDLTIKLSDLPAIGKGYHLQVDIRKKGGDWTTIEKKSDANINIVASTAIVLKEKNKDYVQVYPNPIKDGFTVVLGQTYGISSEASVVLINRNGSIISSLKEGYNCRGELSSGVYYIALVDQGDIISLQPIYIK